jgi:hypothetical protein
MNELAYLKGRAAHYRQLANETPNMALREAFDALAREFQERASRCDPGREIIVVDGVAPDM